MKKKFFALPYLVWMILFTVVPLILIFVYAVFTTTDTGEIIFTTQYLKQALSPENLSVLWRSLEYAVITTIICLILAYPAALILSRLKSKVGAIVNLLFVIPMWMNFLLRTYAWRALLDSNGPINQFLGWFGLPPQELLNTEGAVIMGLVYNFLPFMLLPISSVFSKIDQSYIQAAEDLGANKWQVLRKVIFRRDYRHYHGVHACGNDLRHLPAAGRLLLYDVRRSAGKPVHALKRLEHRLCAGHYHDDSDGALHGRHAQIR